ncbi:RNA-directed DNA polymerase-like protein [Gossypium australe]|uniref:RNA-directed DNA polymerase-like protein n=1 Tax=Gossypium australe TaxID=47621 RepID=A0A5B6VNF8_9ROSI|nr:RNA-directed DNA polymerase-like protein [Gossypium australe]
MPSLSTNIVVHQLPTKEECKSVQQKLRRMRPDILLKIKEKWVANIVPVFKKDRKGFNQRKPERQLLVARDLIKESLKDNYRLPYIDALVANATGYSLLSFMDSFSGYNQIKMHLEDMEKTTFVTM